MEQDKLENLLIELSISKHLVDTTKGPLWFVYPLTEDKVFSSHVYDKAVEDLSKLGAPTIEETKKEHKELGLWVERHDTLLNEIPKFIEETMDKIDNEINFIRKKKYTHWLKQLNQRLYDLNAARIEMLSNTAETLANEKSNGYLVWRCFKDSDGKPLWDTYQDMLEEADDRQYISELAYILYTEMQPINMADLRQLARSGMWRMRWNISKNDICTLFNRGMSDLSLNQISLVYWSQVYDNVYESMDRPPQDIIDDDKALDDWLLRESDKREREIGANFHGKGGVTKTNPKINNSPEVFKIVTGYYNNEGEYVFYTEEERWEQIEKMRSLNSPETRAVQRKGEEELREKPGFFKQEHHIRKTQRAINATGGTVQIRKR